MTQHMQVGAYPDHLGRYRTACGKQLRAEHISGPVTCRACKNTDAWREADVSKQESVTFTVTYEIPGEDHRMVEARWSIADEPEPHRMMIAKQLRKIADELEAGQCSSTSTPA